MLNYTYVAKTAIEEGISCYRMPWVQDEN